jgi:uncharacterized phiE125 gp8 family phage protein
MSLLRTEVPAQEPVSVEEAKLHCGVTVADHDALIATLIAAVREQAEHRTGRSIVDQQWTLTLDEFAPEIRLPMGRVHTVSSVSYVDGDGNTQTLDPLTYSLDNRGEYEQWLLPAVGSEWPSPREQANAVTVVYRAGEASPGSVPAAVKQWILLLVKQMYDQPQAATDKPQTVQPFIKGLLDRTWVPGV